jgi:nitronate monooxygenase
MWPDDRLTKLLGIEIPIIQAPMAGASTIAMAAAVSEAGGLGSLACAAMTAEQVRQAYADARAETHQALNLNFFAHAPASSDHAAARDWLGKLSPYFGEFGVEPPLGLSAGLIRPFDEATCQAVEEISPKIASFHFGLPAPALVQRIKSASVNIMSTATTVAEAVWLADHGCDAVIAQGIEAGGHRGMFLTTDISTQMGTMSLVPQIVDAVNIPVIAAGGVADARGIAAAFALGAAGVQIGTAYLLSDEAGVSPLYRMTVMSPAPVTAITNVMSGRPTRCVVNRAIRDLGPMVPEPPAFPTGFAAMAPLKVAAEQAGLPDFSAHYCGQSAPLAKSLPARQFTRALAAGALKHIASLADRASTGA